MISAAAATVLGPPTCGATARSTPTMSSGVTPSSSALAICHAYEAGGASSAIRLAILTSANVRAIQTAELQVGFTQTQSRLEPIG